MGFKVYAKERRRVLLIVRFLFYQLPPSETLIEPLLLAVQSCSERPQVAIVHELTSFAAPDGDSGLNLIQGWI